MDSTELQRIERRARLRYELSRLKLALVGMAPALLVVLLAACLSKHPHSALLFGAGLFGLGLALLFIGREPRRAVLPGLLLGLLPLSLALCVNHLPHLCMGDHCSSLCVPACAAGGFAAGIGMALLARRHRRGWAFWLAGSSVALLTGAMGCACVGYSGVLGLLAGYAFGLLPLLAQQLLRRET